MSDISKFLNVTLTLVYSAGMTALITRLYNVSACNGGGGIMGGGGGEICLTKLSYSRLLSGSVHYFAVISALHS